MPNIASIDTYLPCWGEPLRESSNAGATGVAHCVELFEQLRGGVVNQVEGARNGLAHNIGGPTAVAGHQRGRTR